MKGLSKEFSLPNPQQNEVAERKNRTLIEAARTMLADSLLPTSFWAKAVSTACCVHNRVLVTKPHNKDTYELLLSIPPSKAFRRLYGCPLTNLNTLDPLANLNGKLMRGSCRSLSKNSNTFRVFNTRTRKGKSDRRSILSMNSILLPLMLSNSPLSSSSQSTDNKDADEVPGKGDDDLSERNGQEKEEGASNKEDDQHVQDFRAELDNLLVQQKEGYANNTNRVSTVNPSVSAAGQGFDNADDQERIDSSTQDVNTVGPSINTASENINTGSSNINTASPIPNDPSMQSLEATGIFDDAYDDREEVGAEADLNNLETTMNVWNSGGSSKGRGLLDLRLKQSGTIEEEYMCAQPSWFEDPHFPYWVYKEKKLIDDAQEIPYEFYGLAHFLLRIANHSQDKYVADILRKFGFTDIRIASTPMDIEKPLLKDSDGDDVDVHLCRSMIRSLMYLTSSRPDIMFAVCACARFQVTPKVSHSHAEINNRRLSVPRMQIDIIAVQKQTVDATSSTKAEYVAAASCCGQDKQSSMIGIGDTSSGVC
ncbi:retrovirus-related pol polyprotein from transposon TNT 1-94 [Tanacetum coccineum]